MNFLYDKFLNSEGISTDSRTLTAGQMFYALNGENFDGSKFIPNAFENGASFVVTENIDYRDEPNVMLVDDSLKSLQHLANFHRSKLGTKIIALTGSNGKTTTKELLFEALSTKFKVSKTQGNLNNHIGVPLTLLKIRSDIEIAIVEMGANKPGDIKELCEIAQPDFGFITNIGIAHLEGFGSKKGVFNTKTEMYHHLLANNKVAFVDAKLNELISLIKEIDLTFVKYNVEPFQVFDESGRMNIQVNRNDELYHLKAQLFGKHNVQNYIAAIDIAQHFGVPYRHSINALSSYMPQNMRSQLIIKDSNQIYLDAYNANPSSMQASISHFIDHSKETILVLGDMKEMGKNSIEYHQVIVDNLMLHQWKQVILVGPDFSKTKYPKHYFVFENIKLAVNAYSLAKHRTCKILIKGSRSMQMEVFLTQFD